MSTIPGSIYGFACGSTELNKIQKIYLFVTAGCVYAIVIIFQIGYSLFQSRVDKCSQDTSTIQFFTDTTYAFIKIYVVGLLPVIAIRKALIQESVRINIAPSLAEDLKILFSKKRAYIVPLIYVISAVSIGSTFFEITGSDRGRKRTMLLYPGDRYFWCPVHRKDNCKGLLPTINEYYLIELIYNIVLGIICGFDFLIYKKHKLVFNVVEPKNMLILHKEFLALWNRKKHVLIWNVIVKALQFGVYFWIAKLVLWNTFYEWLPNLIPFNYTSIYYWVRVSWFDVQLFNRTILCGMFIVTFWAIIHLLFNHFFTRVFSSIGVFMDPHAILIDGLHANQQPYYQQIAFLELWHISKFDHDRRVAIYADFNRKQPFNCALHNSPTAAWTEISRTCMDFILGLANSAQNELKTQQRRKLEMKNKHDLFKKLTETAKKQKQSVKVGQRNLDVGVTADTLTKDREYWEMKLLEWFHPVGGNQRPFVRKLYCLIVVPLFKRSIERRTKNVFKDLHITVYAIQALTMLTVKSLHEDVHGIVQIDISKVFESMLDCLMSLERYAKEPPLDDWDIGDPFANTPYKVLADPFIVINAIKDALFDLSAAFMPNMDYVKLTSVHYDRLDKLMNERM